MYMDDWSVLFMLFDLIPTPALDAHNFLVVNVVGWCAPFITTTKKLLVSLHTQVVYEWTKQKKKLI